MWCLRVPTGAFIARRNGKVFVTGNSGFPKGKRLAGGWNTSLKPAVEHWIVARKPLSESTVAANVLRHGTGALNIDACRTGTIADNPGNTMVSRKFSGHDYNAGKEGWDDRPRGEAFVQRPEGRWPANLLLSHSEGCRWVGDRQVKTGTAYEPDGTENGTETIAAYECAEGCPVRLLDAQSAAGNQASRFFNTFDPAAIDDAAPFFYAAKASRRERNEGLEHLPQRPDTQTRVNNHPTVKSLALMRHLVRLVTPPGGTVLDPFAGSGSTGVAALREGFNFVGIEREPEYVEVARARLHHEAPQIVRRAMP